MIRIFVFALIAMFVVAATVSAEPMKALIVDGQNNHGVWPTTTKMMKKYLEETGLFTVDVATSPPGHAPAEQWQAWKPDFTESQKNNVRGSGSSDAWNKFRRNA